MQDTRALLELIYKNAEMGIITIPQLLNLTKHKAFTSALREELKEYEEISKEARAMIRDLYGEEPNGLSAIEKIRTEITMRMSTFRDTSVQHIADMIVKGNSMGITDIAKQMKTYRMASEGAKSLGEKLKRTQEQNLDTMKSFLSVV